MKRTALIAVGLASLACAAPAAAETITTVTAYPSFPAAAPYTADYAGKFTASDPIADRGSALIEATFGAVPSPATGTLQTLRTLTGRRGTLVLRCNQRVTDVSNPLLLPDVGTCVVMQATGDYAGLSGPGPITGTYDVNKGEVVDTLMLGS
jgi:hypothetical protein